MFKQKQMRLAIAVALASGSLLVAASASAESEHHDEEHRQHDAHEHGAANMTIALDGKQLVIELDSPAMNILGFEHSAETPEHKAVAADMLQKLKRPDGVVSLDGGDCVLSSAEVQMPQFDQGNGEKTHEAKHEDEHHDDEEDHQEDKHHDEDHQDGKPEKETHSDIEATYNFECATPEQLKSMTVEVFESFPNFEEVEAQWILNGRQGGKTLKAGETTIAVK